MARQLIQSNQQQLQQGRQLISSPIKQQTIQPQGDFDFSAIQTLKNIPGSAGRLVKDISQAVLHPIRTAKSLKDVAQGAVSLLIPGEQPNEDKARAVGQFFKDRYGGIENVQKTVQEDPVGFLADISAFLTGGGLAIRGAGAAGKISTISKVGQTIQKVGLATEPLNVLAKGTSIVTRPITKPLGVLARESLGISTGQGGQIIREAFLNPTPEFRQSLRGQTTVDNILTTAREGLDIIKEQRGAAYRTSLAKIKGANKSIDVNKFQLFVDKKLNQFNISVGKDGVLDFSKSVIADTAEQGRIGEVIQAVKTWDDNTALGLDTLKQRLSDFYTTSGKGRALTNSINSELTSILNKSVKGYKKMTADYQNASTLIKEIEGTLSLGKNARADTTIRKLISAMKQDSELKRALVDQIDALTDKNITSQLAGTALSAGVPSGLIGRGIFAGVLSAPLLGVSPTILFGLFLSSPRIVGEFLNALGMSNKAIQSFLEFVKSPIGREILQVQFQAGRIKEVTEE